MSNYHEKSYSLSSPWTGSGEGAHAQESQVPEGQVALLTDLGNGARFVAAAWGRFLHIPASGWGWCHFDGTRWVRDSRGKAMELAARVAQAIEVEADRRPETYGDLKRQEKLPQHAVQSQSIGRLRAMVDAAAEALPDLKASVDDFDRKPGLLNCLNGTVDLRTGQLRSHDPSDKLTQLVPHCYSPDASAPLWAQTLEEALPDPEVRAFFKRAVGYAATGETREHCLLFCFGGGRNGKSLVVGTLLDVLGDYAAPAPPNILMKTNSERHATEIQNLRGYRLVKVDETGRGKAWNEERVKQFTGGDKLKGRRLYEEFDAGFIPTHKFFVLSNYKPRVSGTDDGIWSRIKLIEFPVRFCEPGDGEGRAAGLKVQQTDLRERLAQEAPGILRWVVEGAVSWAQQGLGVPPSVRAAVAAYRDDQDAFRDFIEAHEALRTLGPGESLALPDVVKSYQLFTMGKDGMEHLDSRSVAEELRQHGYEVRRGGKGVRRVRRAGGEP